MKTSVVVASLLLAISSTYASTDRSGEVRKEIDVKAIQSSLVDLPAVEVPVKASALVKAAPESQKLETAKVVLQQVLEKQPQMAIQMVASLIKASPESAAGISSMAISLVPQFAPQILRVAAITAPAQAANISVAAAAVFPDNQKDIIALVSAAVPVAADEIASAVNAAPTRLTTGAVATSHATGGVIVQKKTGISNPFPIISVPVNAGGQAGFDPNRYD